MKKINFLFLFLVLSFCLQAKTIYYVKAHGTGAGTSWAEASGDIQAMINKAKSGDEVWVAKGTYYPTTETIARDARSRTFLIKEGVSTYGGFAGTETAISQRALADLDLNGRIDSCELVNTTLLSGDIDGVADVWTKTTDANRGTWEWTVTGNEGNCYRVVTASGKIDGFSVTGGNSNGSGGGISSSSSVTNCTVSNCSASIGDGGGIYSSSSSFSSVTNCTVSNCSASRSGGGIYSSSSSSSLFSSYVTNCTVSNCSASSGGGIYSPSPSSSVTNCTVSNCSATYGGGIYSSSYSTSITNCTVSNCSASRSGGGIYSSSSVTNCTVSNCSANSDGGGVYSSSAFSSVTNCTVSNCSASRSGGGIYSSSSVTNCTVSNCSANSDGGGIYSSYGDVKNCAASNNKTNSTIGHGISSNILPYSYISPDINIAYKRPTTFIGLATNDAQKAELLTADWRLKEASPCINSGTSDLMYEPSPKSPFSHPITQVFLRCENRIIRTGV